MPLFTPATYNMPILPETQGGEPKEYSLWRHYQGVIPTAYVVLIESGVATQYGTVTTTQTKECDAGSGEAGKAYFRGGIEYDITSAEQTILQNAGLIEGS